MVFSGVINFIVANLYFSYSHTIGLVPYDGVPDKVIVSIHPALTAVFVVLACVGITFAVACLIFNFIYREAK